MTEEIVFEEKQPANEVMSRGDLEKALGSPSLRKACLKSTNPELHLKYLNTVMRWYELQQGYNTQTVEFEEDINFLDSKE
tara:strand:- start:34 stop:273 length:240 start_codon:yes stop_codon:yes gene_type:complete